MLLAVDIMMVAVKFQYLRSGCSIFHYCIPECQYREKCINRLRMLSEVHVFSSVLCI